MTAFSLPSRVNRLTLLSLSILLVSVSTAAAQSDPNAVAAPRRPLYQPVSPMPVEMGFTQDHSSTALEGAQRGRAAVIQALGNYQLDESQAEILREQARALNRENRVKQTQALYIQQEMWSKAREKARNEREARSVEGQQKIAVQRSTVFRQVYQLSSTEFDAKTGAITWPSALLDAKYQGTRQRVEELFRIEVGYGDPQPGSGKEIARNIEDLRRALRSDIHNLPSSEYLAASKFLVGLKVTAESLGGAA